MRINTLIDYYISVNILKGMIYSNKHSIRFNRLLYLCSILDSALIIVSDITNATKINASAHNTDS